jgi:hypothetical protein
MDSLTNPVPQKLTCDDIAKSAEFLRLSKRMRNFALAYIQHYITTGEWDAVRATREAFTYANLNVLRVAACRVRKHPKMVEVLTLFMNSSKTALEIKLDALTREIRDIERNLAASDAGGIAAQRMLSMRREVRREIDKLTEQIANAPPPTPEPLEVPAVPNSTAPHRFKVGELCIVNGKPYTITKVDDEGKALAGEPI